MLARCRSGLKALNGNAYLPWILLPPRRATSPILPELRAKLNATFLSALELNFAFYPEEIILIAYLA